MKYIISIMALFAMATTGFSQSQLNLLDGRQIKLESYVFHTSQGYMDYSFLKKNNKVKNTYADLNNVYSININGKDSIVYKQLLEEEFRVNEMGRIVLGRQDALQEYKPWWAFAAGMIVGSGSLLLPINGMAMFTIPIVYTGSMALLKPSKSYVMNKHESEIGDDLYLYGYQSTGRRKILKNTALGTLGGIFISGVVLASLHFAAQ